jgi:hypothetical protein
VLSRLFSRLQDHVFRLFPVSDSLSGTVHTSIQFLDKCPVGMLANTKLGAYNASLIVLQGSLDALNEILKEPVPMNRFRPK